MRVIRRCVFFACFSKSAPLDTHVVISPSRTGRSCICGTSASCDASDATVDHTSRAAFGALLHRTAFYFREPLGVMTLGIGGHYINRYLVPVAAHCGNEAPTGRQLHALSLTLSLCRCCYAGLPNAESITISNKESSILIRFAALKQGSAHRLACHGYGCELCRLDLGVLFRCALRRSRRMTPRAL